MEFDTRDAYKSLTGKPQEETHLRDYGTCGSFLKKHITRV
jgi:hypothetical protein